MKPMYALVLAAMFLIAGCSSTVTSPDPSTSDVAYFGSESELSAFLAESGASESMYRVEAQSMRFAEAVDTTAVSAPASDDFSGTNVQEQGVDEADIFKTDGEYIYTTSGRTLFITNTGEDAELLSRTDVNMSVQGLFLQEDSLVVIGSEYRNWGGPEIARMSIWPGYGSSDMRIEVYDVSDVENPEQVKTVEFEGRYVDARLKDGVAYVISNSGVSYDRPVPLLRIDGVETSIPVDRIAYFPGHYDDPQLTTVHTLDLGNLDLESDAVLTENTHEVYMDEFLYLSSTSHVNEWEIRQDVIIELAQSYLTADDKDRIERINEVDNDILSPSEKQQKELEVITERLAEFSQQQQDSFEDDVDAAVKQELSQYEYREYTNIAKFAVSADGIDAVADGEIPGRVYDQFGFDEADGALRVVTTTSGIWEEGKLNRESENHLFSLDEDLEVLDSISGIAPGESIFSARYTDDRLYLVTFEQVDPFFVIDVSDNRNLKILGELKITGFSRYLHPVSEDVVLGFGREATETGRQQGLKISLFDVSDVSNPTELTKWVDDSRYASSNAEFEHHAFLMDVDKELLVIPVSSYEQDNRFSGAYVFALTEDSIELRGLVEHDNQVERSAYIGENLYTKSYDLLRVNALVDLEALVDIELEQVSETDVPVY